MQAIKELIRSNRSAIFDILVIGISFTLGLFFPALSDFIRSKHFFNWMLASLLLYTAGAALKDLPMSQRLSFASRKVETVPYILFLVIGHWFIIFFLILLAEPAVLRIGGLPPLTDANAASWQTMLLATVMATMVTWLVYRTKGNRKKRSRLSEGSLYRVELVADILLITGVSIFSFVFWEKGAIVMLGKASTTTIRDIWFLFVFLAILFLFFYLPLRYLFFMEDRKRANNSRRLLLVFGFLLLKVLIDVFSAQGRPAAGW